MKKSESKYFNTAVKMDKALISLMEEKPFAYITISEICARAGVNRSTFYLHYENIGDLLEETTRYLLDGFLAYFHVDTEHITVKFADCEPEELNFVSEKYLHPYLNYIKENHRVFSTMLTHANSFGVDEVYQRLYQHILDPILERFQYPVSDRNYVIRFYLTGINAVVNQWLKDGCQKSVEEVSRIIHSCIFGLNECRLNEVQYNEVDKFLKNS